MKVVRCAIYTRKSSEEGLEQDFNSLDAQREACAAYILSQASEGWTALPDHYDDGGISGGTLERPALRRLLADVASRKLDVIVVYKVDRLSRSLFDFAKLVEAFEKAGTSFVSITQSFNTTSSMGRLTLNMLLSFAQFEREVTAERIRDKITASKAKGMWMGGIPPVGYRPDGRSLAVVEEHAAIVRLIFGHYLEVGNVRRLGERLIQEGICVPPRITSTGRTIGGGFFARGQLYVLLKNRTYIGEIAHHDRIYPALHAPIIEREVFDQAQTMLTGNLQGSHPDRHAPTSSLLVGKIIDGSGNPMVATYACKGTTRYRYYVSRDRQTGRSKSGIRLSASSIETPVVDRIAKALSDPVALLAAAHLHVGDIEAFHAHCSTLRSSSEADRAKLLEVVEQVQVCDDAITISCDRERLARLVRAVAMPTGDDRMVLTIEGGFRWRRGFRLVTRDGVMLDAPKEQALTRLIAQAHGWWAELRKGEMTVADLARREGLAKSYVSRIVRFAFLAPSVIDAALSGTLLAHVDALSLKLRGFPSDWREQEQAMLPRPQPARWLS